MSVHHTDTQNAHPRGIFLDVFSNNQDRTGEEEDEGTFGEGGSGRREARG